MRTEKQLFNDDASTEALRIYAQETAPVLALRLDANHCVTDCNAPARRVLRGELLGRPFAELIVDFTRAPDLTALLRQVDTVHRLTLNTASGQPEIVGFCFFPLPGGTLALGSLDFQEQQQLRDTVLGLNCELNNLTRQRHQANAELRELNQLKNQFLGMAAHGLRKPVGVIMTYSEFVLHEASAQLCPQHQEFLGTCLSAVTSMKRLISKTYLVTSINPEAGRHAMPADAREVQAALRAGDLCWQRYPYFEQRYGERGRRFARSDAAWQATLYQFEPAQISQQVRWLGRVLASRGMPTCLLQEQLEILVPELSAAIPENRSAYEKLLPAAAELHATRQQHLTDEQIEALATGFDRAVGTELSTRLPRTGRLLGCVVADELAGCELAVTSLHAWLTDAIRFPAVWIAAVQETLRQARQLACRIPGTRTNQPELP